ncbi:MAG: hypothetical protein B7Y12_19065 [Rhizobiales bacterium 24-66-13]|nr:MAG: hypothetical protein B7Y61_06775 [Rhizobiales bacterium 35-66-30]OYZ69679.1 MAG: hypothetical protein B7Y12_19065 [Rhizobiales bacterium 24-66-13]OZB03432.1 MAG: hypothetical protein B7X67_17030 [Rhizobiales bacterium 39-66-18]HQS10848.1 hypothetical protein [Xanthobacteraceae bacterium]HQS50125.1 hypothetical protein [Xanthobacteraceae bacterium]
MTLKTIAALSLCLVSTSVFADRPAANKCAAGLAADSQAIYAAAAPQIKPGVDARAVITSQTKSLVMSGQINQGTARASAEAAATCLKMINS